MKEQFTFNLNQAQRNILVIYSSHTGWVGEMKTCYYLRETAIKGKCTNLS